MYERLPDAQDAPLASSLLSDSGLGREEPVELALGASPHTTLRVMRKHLDTVSVVWEEILLLPPSLGGRLTDRNSREQQEDEVVSGAIDCQLTR